MARRRSKGALGEAPRAAFALAVLLAVFAPGYAVDVPWASLLVGIGGAVAVLWLLRQLARPTTPEARGLAAQPRNGRRSPTVPTGEHGLETGPRLLPVSSAMRYPGAYGSL